MSAVYSDTRDAEIKVPSAENRVLSMLFSEAVLRTLSIGREREREMITKNDTKKEKKTHRRYFSRFLDVMFVKYRRLKVAKTRL